jgi:hypothetical protein
LPLPKRTSPTIAGAVMPVATAVWRTIVPVVFAERSIATLRSDVASAPDAPIPPLFSTSVTVPDRSRMPIAVPSAACGRLDRTAVADRADRCAYVD